MPRRDKETDELRSVLARAMKGDHKALPKVREFLDAAPGIWHQAGDLALQAERALVQVASGDNLLVKESLERTLSSLRAELAGPDPTPLERLLVGRVVACWLQLQHADAVYAQSMDGNVSVIHGDYFQRRQDRAHRRYLSAIRTLAQVRRLLLPAIQVNIAEQQVNQQVVQ